MCFLRTCLNFQEMYGTAWVPSLNKTITGRYQENELNNATLIWTVADNLPKDTAKSFSKAIRNCNNFGHLLEMFLWYFLVFKAWEEKKKKAVLGRRRAWKDWVENTTILFWNLIMPSEPHKSFQRILLYTLFRCEAAGEFCLYKRSRKFQCVFLLTCSVDWLHVSRSGRRGDRPRRSAGLDVVRLEPALGRRSRRRLRLDGRPRPAVAVARAASAAAPARAAPVTVSTCSRLGSAPRRSLLCFLLC